MSYISVLAKFDTRKAYLKYSSRALRLTVGHLCNLGSVRGQRQAFSGGESLRGLQDFAQTVPLLCPESMVSSSRPTKTFRKEGRGKAYPSVSSSDEFTCRSDELQRKYTPSFLALIADQEC